MHTAIRIAPVCAPPSANNFGSSRNDCFIIRGMPRILTLAGHISHPILGMLLENELMTSVPTCRCGLSELNVNTPGRRYSTGSAK